MSILQLFTSVPTRGRVPVASDAGLIALGWLGTGTPSGSTYLRGDGTWAMISGGGDALTSNPLSQFAATTSAQLAGVISDETGSGALAFATSPTLVTPALGTPSSGVLTNCTGTAAGLTAGSVTTNANLTGPVTSVGNATTIADAAVTLAKMANLAQDQFIGRTTASTGVPETATITAAARTVLDDVTVAAMVDTLGGASSTGTGGLARATSPTLVTPVLGTPSSGTLTSCTGLPISTGVSGLAAGAATFLATPSSANLATLVTDETGSGALVFGTSPRITTSILDSAGATIIGLTATASADSYITIQNQASGGAPRITVSGAATSLLLVVGTSGEVQVKRGTAAAVTMADISSAQTLASKTLTTPTIGDFTNATHTHQNSAGGGTLDAASIAAGTVATARLGSGSASATNCLLGNQTWGNPAPAAHTTTHKNGGSDEIATATAAANAIPKANSTGLLDYLWIPSAAPNRYCKAGTTNYTAWYAGNLATGVTLTTLAMVANRFLAVPFLAPTRGGTLDRIQVYVTTGVAATNIRLGIYSNTSEAGLYPGALVQDCGASSSASSSTAISLTITQALTPGALYWLVALSDGAPTIRAGSTNQAGHILGTADPANTTYTTYLYASQTYGALPANFPGTPTASTGAFPGIFVRFSA